MNRWTLIRRSLVYHARTHLGVLLGAAVGSTVLVGALVVGDSVKASLRQFALARLGDIQLALPSGDRLFRSELAGSLEPELGAPTVSALQLPGTVARADGEARANQVQVNGVREDFWALADQGEAVPTPGPEEAVLNERLAGQLNAREGDFLVVRVAQPSQLSRDAPVSPQEDASMAMRVKVTGVVGDAQLGRFSLQANQVPPYNAFLSRDWLQQRLGIEGKANLLLVGGATTTHIPLARAKEALQQTWTLADGQIELHPLEQREWIELSTPRVFLDAPVAKAAVQLSEEAGPILTYFVNALHIETNSTPYSMVTAMGRPVVPPDMKDDEILVNQWLADDLAAEPGDRLELRYYIVGASRKLEQRTNSFTVRAILPMELPHADPTLMPEFPGLADAENCRDWDTGFPIELDAIRDKDERYWDEWKGTPKAFVTLAAGQSMWSNRFGSLTAVRYDASKLDTESLVRALKEKLTPSMVGLQWMEVRAQALRASEQSMDFGQLFLGFSFFLIVAALLLMSLLFQFGVEQRTGEVGTMLALGFRPRQVRRLWLGEGAILALLGGLIGMAGGIWYAKAMIYGLSTVWKDAVGTTALFFHAQPATLWMGAFSGAIVAWITIWLSMRRMVQRQATELLAEAGSGGTLQLEFKDSTRRRSMLFGAIASALALALVAWGAMEPPAAAGAFFGAGALLLIGGLFFCTALLGKLAAVQARSGMNLINMGVRNATRRRKRSLATIGLLACGSFLVVAVGANRLDATRNAEQRSSGTGGFALIGQTALPVVQDLNSKEGRDSFGLDAEIMEGVRFVPMRVKEGDDASCLNLNRAQNPRLLGVDPALLAERGAFTFAGRHEAYAPETGSPWRMLNSTSENGFIPGVADQNSILWALRMQLGDSISYVDGQGRSFRVQLAAGLANSILQGYIIISEENFIAHYPSESGYRMFLIDAPSDKRQAVAGELHRALADVGMSVVSATERLAEFNQVQNTYLTTFQVLGGLGLLLGSLGLGVVVLRNVLERRSELALLLAVGFRPRKLKWFVMSEHGGLLLLGLGVGVVAALIAVFPSLLSPGANLPYRPLSLTLAAVFLSGILWTWLATLVALRGELLASLRND